MDIIQIHLLLPIFRDGEQGIDRDFFGQHLPPAGGPEDFNPVNVRGIVQPEIKRHGALRKVTGFSIVETNESFVATRHFDRGSKSIAIGNRADEFDIQVMDLFLVR